MGRQLDFGAKIVAALAKDGIPHRHFVIDTSDNGRAFTGAWYHQHHPNKPLGYAKACGSAGQSPLRGPGHPADHRRRLGRVGALAGRAQTAEKLVDGYLWVSRPWLANQSGSFSMKRALAEVRYSPFQ